MKPRNSVLFLTLAAIFAADAQDTSHIPVRPPLFTQQSGPAALELRALTFPGQNSADETLSLVENRPFTVEALWIRNASPLPASATVQFRIEGAGPRLMRQFPVKTDDWPVGVARNASYTIDFPPLRYSGECTFYVELVAEDSPGPAILWARPAFIKAASAPSIVSAELIEEHFGSAAFPLRRSFRLGPGAVIDLAVPHVARTSTQLLGIVSSTNYDNETRTGETVATLEILDAGGGVISATMIRSGINTAKRDHDEYAPGFLKTRKVSVFQTETADRPSRDTGEAFEVHDYAAILPLDESVTPARLRFRYFRDYGILQVSDIVIFPHGQFGS